MDIDQIIKLNKKAYDEAATQFQAKALERLPSDKELINKFTSQLPRTPNKPHILDIGCGNGNMASLLEGSCTVDVIDISPYMIEIAKLAAPKANMFCADFTKYDFNNSIYDGILAVAFIHLFPIHVVGGILSKIHSIMSPNGIGLISTTKEPVEWEGIKSKAGFQNIPQRFRHDYSEKSFKNVLLSGNFIIADYYENHDGTNPEKIWMNAIISKY